MVVVDLSPGDHLIKWVLDGYSTLQATINVSTSGVITCKSVTGGTCSATVAPTIRISGSTITGYLKAGTTVTGYSGWVSSKGGSSGLLGNLQAVGEIIDGYFGIMNLGFTVTLANVGTTTDYYYGIG